MTAAGTDNALELSLVNDLQNIAVAAENSDALCARPELAEEIALDPSWHFFRLAELDRAGFVSLNH